MQIALRAGPRIESEHLVRILSHRRLMPAHYAFNTLPRSCYQMDYLIQLLDCGRWSPY